jgi:hypothetical protein
MSVVLRFKTSELITKIVPIPRKSMHWQRTKESALIRKKAYADLEACQVGQHVMFYNTDRARATGYTLSSRFRKRCYTICKIDDTTFGAWRIR